MKTNLPTTGGQWAKAHNPDEGQEAFAVRCPTGQFANTKYGFQYGACKVTRIHQTPEGEVYLEIATDREALEIRVTPTGLIRHAKTKKGKQGCQAIPLHSAESSH